MRGLLPLVVPVLLLGCGGDKKSDDKAEGATAVGAAGGGAVAVLAAPPEDAPRRAPVMKREEVKLTRAQRQAFRQHMKAGSSAQKGKQWAEAVAAYEAALAIDPGHARAFSELSWVAFKAEDFAKAREAARSSVTLALDPDVKAASMYNQGRATEALGEVEWAKEIYTDSLRLRPNEIVRKRLVGLGGTPPVATAPPPPCNVPVSKTELCGCLKKAGEAESCAAQGKEHGGLRVWELGNWEDYFNSRNYYLVHKSEAGYAAIAVVAKRLYEGRHSSEEFRLESISSSLAPPPPGLDPALQPPSSSLSLERRVYRVRSVRERSDDSEGVERFTEHTLILCVGEAAGLRCPLVIPVERSLLIDVDSDDPELRQDFIDSHGVAPPIKRGHKLAVTVKDDGQVVIELSKGRATSELKRYVGSHRLW